ncbi:MAG: CBS domain-containing protein [Firmicutes bacterium]|nr:CBS domain-containing protein [Bacillota bacterium]
MGERTETIREFMVPITDYPTINHNVALHEAVNIMYNMSRAKGYRWIVVLDDQKNLVGFLTLRNVMEAISSLAPKAGGWLGIFTYSRPGFFYWEGVQAIKNTPVKKFIKPLVDVQVKETDNPAKAAEIILNRRVTIVPVVNGENDLVGIIRPVDLLPFFNRLFEEAPN